MYLAHTWPPNMANTESVKIKKSSRSYARNESKRLGAGIAPLILNLETMTVVSFPRGMSPQEPLNLPNRRQGQPQVGPDALQTGKPFTPTTNRTMIPQFYIS
jgi:hypothetical protein